MNNPIKIEKEQLWEYLTTNPHKPIFVIENKNIILNLRYNNDKDKVHSEVYVPGTDNVIERDVEVDFLKTINYWKPTHMFYTSLGMVELLDSWEKSEVKTKE